MSRDKEEPVVQNYEHEWVINIKADDLKGAMDAVWNCWTAWQEGKEPLGGACPRGMGNRMTYDVHKPKSPTPVPQ